MTTGQDWTKPAAMAIPPEGYFTEERGRYGPVYPRTPACHGFSIIAKVEGGPRGSGPRVREDHRGDHRGEPGGVGAAAVCTTCAGMLFDVGSGLHFQYQGIFDTDFDKYTEDAVQLFSATGITTMFTNSKGSQRIGRRTRTRSSNSSGSTRCPSFLEYGEYPYVTADEIKKALKLKAAFSEMLDQMQ